MTARFDPKIKSNFDLQSSTGITRILPSKKPAPIIWIRNILNLSRFVKKRISHRTWALTLSILSSAAHNFSEAENQHGKSCRCNPSRRPRESCRCCSRPRERQTVDASRRIRNWWVYSNWTLNNLLSNYSYSVPRPFLTWLLLHHRSISSAEKRNSG